MRQGHAQRLDHDLRRGRGAEELAPSARAGTRPAAELGGLLQAQLTVGVAGTDGLNLAGVLALARGQGDPARHQHGGQVS